MAPIYRQNRSVLSGVGVIILAVALTVAALSAFLNYRCQSRFWDALEIYPGAEQIEQQSVFMGLQRVVYHSSDAPAAVERWYAEQDAARMREAVLSGDFTESTLWRWVVEPDTQRGGSLLTAQTTCP